MSTRRMYIQFIFILLKCVDHRWLCYSERNHFWMNVTPTFFTSRGMSAQSSDFMVFRQYYNQTCFIENQHADWTNLLKCDTKGFPTFSGDTIESALGMKREVESAAIWAICFCHFFATQCLFLQFKPYHKGWQLKTLKHSDRVWILRLVCSKTSLWKTSKLVPLRLPASKCWLQYPEPKFICGRGGGWVTLGHARTDKLAKPVAGATKKKTQLPMAFDLDPSFVRSLLQHYSHHKKATKFQTGSNILSVILQKRKKGPQTLHVSTKESICCETWKFEGFLWLGKLFELNKTSNQPLGVIQRIKVERQTKMQNNNKSNQGAKNPTLFSPVYLLLKPWQQSDNQTIFQFNFLPEKATSKILTLTLMSWL